MKRIDWLIVSIQAVLVVLLVVVSRTKAIPLGVRGEWEWSRISELPTPHGLLMAVLAIAGYCGFAGIGLRARGQGTDSGSRSLLVGRTVGGGGRCSGLDSCRQGPTSTT